MTADASYVAAHMRQEDADELWRLGRSTPRGAVERSIGMSNEAYVAYVDDVPVAVFGAHMPVIGSYGVPWFLGTRGVDDHAAEYIAWGRRFTDHLLETCDVLQNMALASNRRSLVFLKRIGFAIGEPFRVATGAEAVLFRRTNENV